MVRCAIRAGTLRRSLLEQGVKQTVMILPGRAHREELAWRGKAHGAVIEDDPTPRVINGTSYWQLSFVENRADKVQRRESFLVAKTGEQILVDDTANDTVVSLDEWRRGIRRVETKSAD